MDKIKLPQLEQESIVAVVDSREQRPWNLHPLQTTVAGLHVGDYSVQGLESTVAIERKSLPDFVSCCGTERERFQRELNALRGWPVSAVVVEATWDELGIGAWRSQLTPAQVKASAAAWIAQSHCLIFGGSVRDCEEIARGILFYSARYQWKRAKELAKGLQLQSKHGE